MDNYNIKIGSRRSKLAMQQSKIVSSKLEKLGYKCEIIGIKTSGDVIRSKLSDCGGKGLFIKQLEEELLENTIDIAVHSLKDVPAFIHPKLSIPCVIKRDKPNDILISKRFSSIKQISKNAIIGTSSYRRQVFLDGKCNIMSIRGNIDTRIQKTKLLDGIILAQAGIERLQMEEYIRNTMKMNCHAISTDVFIPAPGQGTIALQIVAKNHHIYDIIKKISDENTMICSIAERSFMKFLNADCNVPMAAHATLNNDCLKINAMLKTQKGTFYYCIQDNKISYATKIGFECAKKLAIDSQYNRTIYPNIS